MRILVLLLCYSNEMWPLAKAGVMQLWGGDRQKDDVGAGWYSRATFTFQFRLWVFLFAIFTRLLRHQSSNQTTLRLSKASVVSLRAGFGVAHNFTLRPKWWWIIHPGLFHLGWQKWLGVGGSGGGGRFVRFRQTNFRPLAVNRYFISQRRCRACHHHRCYVRNQSSRAVHLFH